MEMKVERCVFTDKSTRGLLYVNGEYECYTLEPAKKDGDEKPRAIPAGTYNVVLRMSEKHKRMVPGVEDVPGFSDIEIHPGNYPSDTLGCLLVGTDSARDLILHAQDAFHTLMEKLQPHFDNHDIVTITYCEDNTGK